jgi:hypothetical protein
MRRGGSPSAGWHPAGWHPAYVKELLVTNPSEIAKSETVKIDDHIVTVGCLFHADTGRWEPTVSIRPSWASGEAVRITAKPEHFQDAPHDAMAVAHEMAKAWVAEHAPPEGTVDAAV